MPAPSLDPAALLTAETSGHVRPATAADAASIATIYNHYVENTVVTFEEQPVSPAEMERRMADVAALSLPWFVVERDARVLGYAYATAWRARSAYRFSVEVTVYLPQEQARRGLGAQLYAALFPALEARGVHAVMAGIALPNAASEAIHERFGMRKVAHFAEVGFKFGRWVDVGYWQRILATK